MKGTVLKTSYQAIDRTIEASDKEELREKINRIIDEIPPFFQSNKFVLRGIITLSREATELAD